ncbi:MAG: heat-inducible transcriptional repressor HrcA [Candidatus Dormibacteria bacterium]
MDGPIPLDARKQQILKAVVSDYTETGVPVGSHALAAHLASWSSATIRNELANLVDVGYLLQPHTSAGRIPSDRGYRYYVDFLMVEELLPAAVRRQLEPYFAGLPLVFEELLEAAALALAVVSDSVSIVTGPRSLGASVKHLDLVSLDPDHALLILVLEGNVIRQQAVTLSQSADQEELSGLAAALRGELRGLATAAVEAAVSGPGCAPPAVDAAQRSAGSATTPGRITGNAPPAHPLRAEVIGHIAAFMRSVDVRQDTVVVHDGVRNLLRKPEFGDLERLQAVLELVEEERVLGSVLASLELDGGVRMMIGAENDLEQLQGCSLVVTTYRAGEGRYGTIGVLGPTRMRYSQLAPRVRHVSERLGRSLERLLG